MSLNDIEKSVRVFRYCETDLNYVSSWNSAENESCFDLELATKWKFALLHDHFRYKLHIVASKVLPGEFGYIAQLNPDRGHNRRQPEAISGLNQPYDPARFNFSRVKPEEYLFEVSRSSDTSRVGQDYLLINASPFEFGHSLFVPSLDERLAQVITVDSFTSALDVLLLSATPALRLAFNSLCAHASVNHLHYHFYYLRHRMRLEHINVRHLSGPCYELTGYPGRGFVLQLDDNDVAQLARSVHKLTNLFQRLNVAHNVMATRGTSLSETSTSSRESYDTVRVYVWPRQSSTGAKDTLAFSPAVCELFGHLSIKDATLYDSLTEDSVSATLNDITSDTFDSVRPDVIQLFRTE